MESNLMEETKKLRQTIEDAVFEYTQNTGLIVTNINLRTLSFEDSRYPCFNAEVVTSYTAQLNLQT